MDKSREAIAETLGEDYKEWLIFKDPPVEKGDQTTSSEERLGIVCYDSFILSMASDSRLPSNGDLSRLIHSLFTFAQSKKLTVLAIMSAFEKDQGTGYLTRELLLWPLTSQAASKLAVFRKIDSDMGLPWGFWEAEVFGPKFGLDDWDDARYDPEHIVDRKEPLKKARASSSLASSEETFAVENTWRRVWTMSREGANREDVAKCLLALLRKG